MSTRLLALAFTFLATAVHSESITYELYELSDGGARTLVAGGTRQYTSRDVLVQEHRVGEIHWWTKEVVVANGFSAGASIYRERDLSGFGLWLKDRQSIVGRLSGGGFSWDWFDRESGNVYRKLQGEGRVRVSFVAPAQVQEIASIEVIEDITLRLKDRPWFLYFVSDSDTHNLVIKKGSVLRFAP
jgi:hypothetical protein